jgi:hypothetical protein
MMNPNLLSPVPLCEDEEVKCAILELHEMDMKITQEKDPALEQELIRRLQAAPDYDIEERIDMPGGWLYIGGYVRSLRTKYIDRNYAGPHEFSPWARKQHSS